MGPRSQASRTWISIFGDCDAFPFFAKDSAVRSPLLLSSTKTVKELPQTLFDATVSRPPTTSFNAALDSCSPQCQAPPSSTCSLATCWDHRPILTPSRTLR